MRPLSLSPSEQAILDILKRLAYGTEAQLVYWSKYHVSTVSRALSGLKAMRFVACEKALLPHIWYLTRKAGRLLQTALPSGLRKPSGAVMLHTVHRNQCEIVMREQYPEFRFMDKVPLYRIGLDPSKGEHAGFQDKHIIFVLLDDYLMGSDRISAALKRYHKKKGEYCTTPGRLRWPEVFDSFFIATTDRAQIERHRAWVNRRGIQAELLYIKPIWAF